MLKIISGKAGTGKSAAIMGEIGAAVSRKEGNRILLVPEQYSHEAEREMCAVCGDSMSLYAEVLSFTGLARRVGAECGQIAVPYIDKGGKLLCMALAADGLYSRLKVYSSARKRAEMLPMLISAADELKTACISSGELAAAAESCEGLLSDKLSDLSLLFEAYNSVISNGRADPSDRLSVLCEQIPRSSICETYHFYIDGFTDFTAQELKVIEALLVKKASITLCLSCDNLKHGSEIFELSRRTAARLLSFAEKNGIENQQIEFGENSAKNEALSFFSDNMFSYSAVKYGKESKCIGITEAYGIASECEFAASAVRCLVRESGCRWRDIAIAVRGFEDYRPALESAFARYDVPLFTARKSDMLSKPVPALVAAAYEIIGGGWEAEDVMAYLRTGLGGLDSAECDMLENYLLLWQLHGSAWHGRARWGLHPDGMGKDETDDSKEKLNEINRLRFAAAEPLLRFEESAGKAKTAREQAVVLAELFESLSLSERLEKRADYLAENGREALAQEYMQLWDICVASLEQCEAILGDAEMDFESFGRLYTLMLSKYDVGIIPAALDRVTAGDFDRMRRRSIKHLIVLGADDSRLPQGETEGGMFSEDERKRLLELNIDLGGEGDCGLWREFSLIYNCLTLPSESLKFCYSAFDGKGEACRPSFVVNRARVLFGIDTEQFDADKGKMNAPEPCLELAAEAMRSGGQIQTAAKAYFEQQAPEKLEKLRSAAGYCRGRLSEHSVNALYGEKIRLSASRIDKFASCRFAYFMQYGLKAKRREPAVFSPPEMGTFMHYVLENTARDIMNAGGFKKVDDDAVRAFTDKYIAEYIHLKLNDFSEKSERFKYLFRRLTVNVQQVVGDMVNELRASDFEPLAFELDFGKTEELPPLEIGSGSDSLILTGIADRVDGWLHDGKLYLRVVDYKTGRREFSLSDVWYGMGLQMLLYLFSLEKNGQKLFENEIVPAGVLYVPARDVILSAKRDMDDEEIAAARMKEKLRSGLILEDEAVINAMEHGDSPRYIPVSFKKGVPSGDALASAERLGLLSRHIDETLSQMAHELHAGSITADPYYKQQQDNACINCDYFDACHFEDGENGERLRVMHKLSATKVWNVLEGGNADG